MDANPVNNEMTRQMDVDWVRTCFAEGVFDGAQALSGDHHLNPGFQNEGELRKAAVLIPLIDRNDGLTVLLTKRTDHLDHHPGQISFPGGHVEEADETHEQTALRETEEEVGITPEKIDVIGSLGNYETRTGFLVTPVVGIISPPLTIKADEYEVAEVFEVPFSFLMNDENHEIHARKLMGNTRHYYAMPYKDYYIWGATAGMLKNLHDFLVNR